MSKEKLEVGSKWINKNDIKLEILGVLSPDEVKQRYPWLAGNTVYNASFSDGDVTGMYEGDLLKYYVPCDYSGVHRLKDLLQQCRKFINMTNRWNREKILEEREKLLPKLGEFNNVAED